MSCYIATRAIRGAHQIVAEFETALNGALAEHGPETPISFPNTAYYLLFMLGV
jgi:hypothetical protein